MNQDLVVFRLKKPNYTAYFIWGLLLLPVGIGIIIFFAALAAKATYDGTLIEVTKSSLRYKAFNNALTEVPFTKINSVTLLIVSKKKGYGNLTISLGNDIVGLNLKSVQDVEALNTLLQSKISGTPVSSAKTAPDRLDALERLASLRTSGALTESEYRTEKARLLK